MNRFIWNMFFPIVLVLISILILSLSHQGGNWLSGWDTLHPEFNFNLAFQRLLFGVFRPEQGLGAVTAHAHISDLPRVIILYLMSFFFPVQDLRYLFISLCLILGVLGVFRVIRDIILPKLQYNFIFAFLGALFYLFNLGTLQQFYVPFEMFTVQYAALPWLFYFAAKYLLSNNKKNLAFFALTTILAAPMAFASTLWFAYFLALVLYLSAFVKTNLRQVIVLLSLTLVVNSFWLLPNLYFIFSGNASLVSQARVNKIFSQEAFAYNQSYGNLTDTLILKNFLFDWLSYNPKLEHFEYLFQGWRSHLASSYILAIGYFLSSTALLGALGMIILKKKLAQALILPSLAAVIFLINQNPPLTGMFALFREQIPLFSEALRFPFTKFSLILAFTLSLFFGFGQYFIFSLYQKLPSKVVMVLLSLQVIIFSSLFFIYMKPMWQGDFISKIVQVNIPNDYFSLFDWFKNQPQEKRIAILPIHSFWGWIYYQWGFQGAQFISFGLPQPLLDRDYDRWNTANENYYQQMSSAIYAQDQSALNNVLEKYQISYLILDKNVIAPSSEGENNITYDDQTISMLLQNPKIKLVEKFNNLLVFEVNLDEKGLIFAPKTITKIASSEGPINKDWIYSLYNNYVNLLPNSAADKSTLYLPFLPMSDNQNIINKLFSLTGKQLNISTQSLPSPAILSLADFLNSEKIIPADFNINSLDDNVSLKLNLKTVTGDKNSPPLSLFYKLPISIDSLSDWIVNIDQNQTIEGSMGSLMLSSNSSNDLAFYSQQDFQAQPLFVFDNVVASTLTNCQGESMGQEMRVDLINDESIRLFGKSVQACLKIPVDRLVNKQDIGDYKTLAKLSLHTFSQDEVPGHICLFDLELGRCVKEQKYIFGQNFITTYFLLDQNKVSKLELRLFLDNLGSLVEKEVIYSNLNLALALPQAVLTIPADDLKKAVGEQKININNQTGLNLDFTSSDLLKEVHLSDQVYRSSSCSSILPKSFSRQIKKDLGVIEYSSEGGSSCDFFSFPDLPHNTSYILEIKSQNLTGLPLRVCVTNNLSKRCDLYLSLPANKKLTSQLLLLPAISDGGAGYDIHFDNFSAGKVISTNNLGGVRILPFPYTWLSQVVLTHGDNIKQPSGLNLKSFKQIMPGFWWVDFQTKDQEGLLVLNQSYDQGFFLAGAQHVRVNDWANGWIIPKSQTGTKLLFFWPQLLQWFGFGLGLGAFIILIWKRLLHNTT